MSAEATKTKGKPAEAKAPASKATRKTRREEGCLTPGKSAFRRRLRTCRPCVPDFSMLLSSARRHQIDDVAAVLCLLLRSGG